LNGRLTMTRSGYWDAGALNFSGDQTLGGTGEILFSQSGNRRSGGQTNYVQPVDGGTLTI
ncbi:hypothetical protein D3OALGA1CA_28, partial [Olavius algarvensis associated proteobacterium Delta 3]